MTCEPGCTCRGTNGMYASDSECYTTEVRRQVRIVRDLPIDELQRSIGRHPSTPQPQLRAVE